MNIFMKKKINFKILFLVAKLSSKPPVSFILGHPVCVLANLGLEIYQLVFQLLQLVLTIAHFRCIEDEGLPPFIQGLFPLPPPPYLQGCESSQIILFCELCP